MIADERVRRQPSPFGAVAQRHRGHDPRPGGESALRGRGDRVGVRAGRVMLLDEGPRPRAGLGAAVGPVEQRLERAPTSRAEPGIGTFTTTSSGSSA